MKKLLIFALLCCCVLYGKECHPYPCKEMVLATEQHSYVLQNCVGGGSSGAIYKATSEDGRTVAIKIFVRNQMSDRCSVEREWMVGTQFNHPNIIKAYDRGIIRSTSEVNDPKPFIVFEFVSGLTFLQVFEKNLCQETIILLLVQLLDALKYGSIKGMHYQDLQLANMMMTEDNNLKIVDLESFVSLASKAEEDSLMNIHHFVKQILKKSGYAKKKITKQMKEALKKTHEKGLTSVELYTSILDEWSLILQLHKG